MKVLRSVAALFPVALTLIIGCSGALKDDATEETDASGGSIGASGGAGGVIGTGGSGATSSEGASSGGVSGDNALPKDKCRTPADCDTETLCLLPGESAGFGFCIQPESWCDVGEENCALCESDTDCDSLGELFVCEQQSIFCTEQKACVVGCSSDSQCREGEACLSDHRCGPTSCSISADCPADFDCDAGYCYRRSCTDDGSCDGHCVKGECYPTFGSCAYLPA